MKLSIAMILLPIYSLFSVVESVEIKWNAFKCLDDCVASIEKNLRAIRSVSNIKITARDGRAEMQWNPNEPFSYEPFRLASAAVGIKIDEMRVRVTGTIVHDPSNYYLISGGDGSRFTLMGPIYTEPGRYSPKYSFATHPLTPRLIQQLSEATKQRAIVTISGPLYLPNRWPRYLIIEQIKTNDSP